MAAQNLPDRVLGLVDNATATFIEKTFNNLWIALEPSFRLFLLLFFTLYGLALWRGVIKAPVENFIWSLFKFSIIYGVISSWPTFSTYIVDFFTLTPDALANAVTGTSGASSAMILGDVYIIAMDKTAEIFDQGGYVLKYILGFIFFLAATVMVIYAVFLIALSKIAIAVLVGLGPIFIILLMFTQTRKIFEAWLQQLINYTLITLLVVTTLTLTNDIAAEAVSTVTTGDVDLGEVTPAIVMFLIIFLFLTQVMQVAAALSGGISLSTQHVGSAIARRSSGLSGRAVDRVGRGASIVGSWSTNRLLNRLNQGRIAKK